MNPVCSLSFLFAFGCLIGWGMEALFRRGYSGEWINPGFLTGPALPMYGFGLCLLYLLALLGENFSLGNLLIDRILLIILMTVCLTLLEYVAGLIFIKKMKTQLWDYSNEKWNFQGIICFKYSLLWAVLCAVYLFFIHPFIGNILKWFSAHLSFLFFLGMFYGIFLIDLCNSFRLVSKIKAFAEENDILIRYEELKTNIRNTAKEQKEKYRYLFAFSSRVPLMEHLKKYLSLIQAFALDKQEKEDAENDGRDGFDRS